MRPLSRSKPARAWAALLWQLTWLVLDEARGQRKHLVALLELRSRAEQGEDAAGQWWLEAED